MPLSLDLYLLFLLKRIKFIIYKILYQEQCCNICGYKGFFKNFGNPIRKMVKCPICGSLERHRSIYPYYEKYFLKSTTKVRILHTAPEKCFSDLIIKNKNIEYYPIDLYPEKYQNIKCIKADVTDLPFEDNFFDFVLTSHVMEHIKNDQQYLSEMIRVLKPQGKMFLMFPYDNSLDKTLELDNIVTPEDRLKYYGQEDHVRKYGRDVIQKLKYNYNAEILDIEVYAKLLNVIALIKK